MPCHQVINICNTYAFHIDSLFVGVTSTILKKKRKPLAGVSFLRIYVSIFTIVERVKNHQASYHILLSDNTIFPVLLENHLYHECLASLPTVTFDSWHGRRFGSNTPR